MNRDNDRQTSIILSMIGILPVVWLGLLIAPSVKGGLPEILPSLMNVMSDPFHIELCDPYDIEQQRKEMKEFLDDLTTRDQRMMFTVLTMVHTADTKEQLDNDTEALLTTARRHMCQFGILKFQQLDGLNTALPFGVRKIDSFRTLTTESLAVFIPFRVTIMMPLHFCQER